MFFWFDVYRGAIIRLNAWKFDILKQQKWYKKSISNFIKDKEIFNTKSLKKDIFSHPHKGFKKTRQVMKKM